MVLDLYSLACAAHDPTGITAASRSHLPFLNFKEQVIDTLTDEDQAKPCLILQRLQNSREDSYWIGNLRNAFYWRIVWQDRKGFHDGPLLHRGDNLQVVVLEDTHFPVEDQHPSWQARRAHARHNRTTAVSPQEIVDVFTALCEPTFHHPIEDWWVRDIDLPTSIVDGVPESAMHSVHRQRSQDRDYQWLPLSPRLYLEDPNWEVELARQDNRKRQREAS